MKNLLERIAISGTENRRAIIEEILKENNIPYELQVIERKKYNFSKYWQRSKYEEHYRKPKFEDECLDSFIDEDPEFDLPEDELSEEEYDERLLTMMYACAYGMYSSNETFSDIDEFDDEESIDESQINNSDDVPDYEIEYRANIIVHLNNNYGNSKNKLLLSAHYDVVPGSTGANDNASSVTILLKLAKYLKDNCTIPAEIVFFDGEETGGFGSREYIEKYIPEEEKNNITLINLDVCGCGDYIVIVDKILNENSKATILTKQNIKEKYYIKEAERFPFSDASIFNSANIGTLGISVFPVEDTRLLDTKENLINKEQELIGEITGKTYKIKEHFGSNIWNYMHNGKYDDISYINYNIMEQVYRYLLEIFK